MASDENLLTRWRHLHLRDRCSSLNPSQNADNLRNFMVQVEYARASQIVDHEAASSLCLHYMDRYAKVVDLPEEQDGVNNYADGVLALLVGRRNESKKWTSSLKRNASNLPCVKSFLQTSQAYKTSVVPPGKENTALDFHSGIEKTSAGSKKPDPTADSRSQINASKIRSPSKAVQQPNSTSILRNMSAGNQIRSNSPTFTRGVDMTSTSTHMPLFQSGIPAQKTNRFPANDSNNGHQNFYQHNPVPGSSGSALFGQQGGNQPFYNRGTAPARNDDEVTGWGRGKPTAEDKRSSGYAQFHPANHFQRREAPKRPFQDLEDNDEDDDSPGSAYGSFRTAKEQLAIDAQRKHGGRGRGSGSSNVTPAAYGTNKKSLGTRRGPAGGKFVPPTMNKDDNDDGGSLVRKAGPNKQPSDQEEPIDERLKNFDQKMVELIMSEIMDHGPSITWEDIAGLEFAKKTIKEIVVWPMLRPDIFTGLRGPPKGLLLFGPPGTGKTLIGKCIASQSKSTFFSISASSLTSKWVGEGEKMVRALFAVARIHQPAVIFIDEIDSLLSQRSDGEHESSRRIKTEFLVQLDGATTGSEDRILVVGATNRPQEIDEAARRRFVKRLYIPLPEEEARHRIITNLLTSQNHYLMPEELSTICRRTEGYSGADMANLCREAALGPIRSIPFAEIENISADQVRPITYTDFDGALTQVRASVSEKDLDVYLDWNKQYGSWAI